MNHANGKDYAMLAFILEGEVRIKIVVHLLEKRRSYASQIAREEDIRISSVYRAMKDLKARKVIRCLNPTSPNIKLYELTPTALALKDPILEYLKSYGLYKS